MLNLETIVNQVKKISKKNGLGAGTNEIKDNLGLGKSHHIKDFMKECVEKGYLIPEKVGVGKNLYKVTKKGLLILKKNKNQIQEKHEIPTKTNAPVKYQKSTVATNALNGLTAVAGVIAENDLLQRKLLLIRNQLTKLLGVDTDGTSTTESDNDTATEESDRG
jgi:hypothetical protein